MEDVIDITQDELANIESLYNWHDCSAVFVCEPGNWRCTTAQFYQSNECRFPPEEPPAGHTGNPLEGYVTPKVEYVTPLVESERECKQKVVTEVRYEKPQFCNMASAGNSTVIIQSIALIVIILVTALLWLRKRKQR